MKKLTAIIILVMVVLMATPGYADSDALENFIREVVTEKEKFGEPQIFVESQMCIIVIFGLQKVMRKLKYYKMTDTYEIKEIKKIDTAPSDWDQTPQERLREALTIYGIGKTTD